MLSDVIEGRDAWRDRARKFLVLFDRLAEDKNKETTHLQ
jgi:hypothetical protein